MLWREHKKAIHVRKTSGFTKLKHLCKEEWAKISPHKYERLIDSSRKLSISVVPAERDPKQLSLGAKYFSTQGWVALNSFFSRLINKITV